MIATIDTLAASVQDVSTPCAEYTAMAQAWPLITDLLGGTAAMRKAGRKWLPKEQAEEDDQYDVRLNRSILYEAYPDTIKRLGSKPFSRAVQIHGGLPDSLVGMEENVDGHGRDLTQFGRALFDDALNRGKTHFLVDYPLTASKPDDTREEIKARVNELDEQQLALRPRFVHIRAADLIGWKWREDSVGRKILAQIRFLETRTVPDGPWNEKQEVVVRVLYENRWELHVQSPDKKTWIVDKSGPLTLGKIPLVTIYLKRVADMVAEPPMNGLAWLNLAHWQSDSDQRNCLRFNRFGKLFMKGLSDEEKENPLAVGPATLFRSTNTDADMKVVEGTGAALESGRKDLSDLEARMEAMGLAPFMERSANSTATGKMIDHTNSQCDLQAWIRSEERGLRQGFELAAEYKNAKLVEKFRVDIHNDFGMADRAAQEMDVLVKMNAMDAFSDQSLFEEAQRRGYVIEGRTWKQEQFRIEVQGPPMPRGAPTPPDGSAPIDQAQDADEDGDGDDERRAA